MGKRLWRCRWLWFFSLNRNNLARSPKQPSLRSPILLVISGLVKWLTKPAQLNYLFVHEHKPTLALQIKTRFSAQSLYKFYILWLLSSYRISINKKDISQISSTDRIRNVFVFPSIQVSSIHLYHVYSRRVVALCKRHRHDWSNKLWRVVVYVSYMNNYFLATLVNEEGKKF